MKSAPAISVGQTFNQQITVAPPTGAASVYRYGALPKACVHPLNTPAGRCLSGFEMSDHVWHRGLWFTIKFVNGTNFWEEQPPFGVQVSAAEPATSFLDAAAASISHDVKWTSDETGDVIGEHRTLTFHGDGESRFIDWSCDLKALKDMELDRTPYTTWGGYGGLAFRGSRELHEANFLLPGGETVAGVAGQPANWCVMQGLVDGAGPGRHVSIGMIDHPANPRTPSPWYCKAGNGFNYLNAAFLFHEPLAIPRGRSLKFRYRVAYRDGLWSADEFQKLAEQFRNAREK